MAWRSNCCNPFKKPGHNVQKKSLRSITSKMCTMYPEYGLTPDSRICDNCRKQLAKKTTSAPLPSVENDPISSSSSTSITSPEITELHVQDDEIERLESLKTVSKCLEKLGETPMTMRKIRSKKYAKNKLSKITEKMDKIFIDECKSGDDQEIVLQLKEKFHAVSDRSVKTQILTILPKSWSIQKVQTEFGATNFMVRKAKQLVKEKGVLSSPDPRPGHCLSKSTVDRVVAFYESDNSSRMMPGKKDFVSVKSEHGREHVQKRLILSNLKELYQLFKQDYPLERVGFSKFAELRPKHCILAGAKGTHSVCVCTIHQNVKLMIQGMKLHEATSRGLTDYHTCLAKIMCNPPLPICYLGECNNCPGIEPLKDTLVTLLDENLIDNITYKQWTAVDRSTLETMVKSSDDFVDSLCEKLEVLRSHSFIATQQAKYYEECKTSLEQGEVLVSADFSENYAFVLQDAAQGFHWNNSQCTIHPFIVYFRESLDIHHRSFVVISDCLQHDTVAVHLFQRKLIDFLKTILGCTPKKLYYFSDGAASQYKNRKNFLNLCYHKDDFGMFAEWHFSATSHGKGPCDGLGGTVKRLAAKASLQRPYEEQIMTPIDLYEWASQAIPSVTFVYCSNEEYHIETTQLNTRFLNSRTIPGTRSLHCFIPISKHVLATKRYSLSSLSKNERVTKHETDIDIEQISGYVTCKLDNMWWLACVLEKDIDNAEIKLSFLHPHGPSQSFKYPASPDINVMPISNILTAVEPRTTTGRRYSILQKDAKEATNKLKTIA